MTETAIRPVIADDPAAAAAAPATTSLDAADEARGRQAGEREPRPPSRCRSVAAADARRALAVRPGRRQESHAPADALDRIPPAHRRSAAAALPELNEPEVVRHFVNLSHLNYAVDTGFYPLGSCTMKFNPKMNEWAARLRASRRCTRSAPDAVAQGSLAAAVGAAGNARRDQSAWSRSRCSPPPAPMAS